MSPPSSIHWAPRDAETTDSYPVVHPEAQSLENQAVLAIERISRAFHQKAASDLVKQNILGFQAYVEEAGLIPDEALKRIEEVVRAICTYFYNEFRVDFVLIESVYPGFTDRFMMSFGSYAESLITTTRCLLESGVRIDSIRRSIQNSLVEVLNVSRVSFYHQKWEGAYNRRGFEHYRAKALHAMLRQRIKHGENSPSYASQIMVDLDKFKDVNDRYGTVAGDRVLRDFLSILRRTAREIDVIGMPGGDEYLLFLPNTDEAGAASLVSRIVQNFETHTFFVSDRDGLEVALDGRNGRPKIGVSIGITTVSLPISPAFEPKTVAAMFADLDAHLDKESELAMEGAKVLDKNGNGHGGSLRNVVMTFVQASARREEIDSLIAAKNTRRSES